MRQKLVQMRNNSNINSANQLGETTEKNSVTVNKILEPHVTLNLSKQLRINKLFKRNIDYPNIFVHGNHSNTFPYVKYMFILILTYPYCDL